MKNIKGLFALVSVCLWAFSSCDSGGDGTVGSGKLRLSLAADTVSVNKGVSNATKSVGANEFDRFLTTDDYRISIRQASDTVCSFDRFDQMPSEIELPEGFYTLVASKGDNLPAAFENPYFEGSADFTVKSGMNTPLDVVCSLGNARVSVEYTSVFQEAYEDYAVLLSTSLPPMNLRLPRGNHARLIYRWIRKGRI